MILLNFLNYDFPKELIRGLGSWEPSRSLELRKLLGAVVANCAELPGTVGADWHPDVLGA